MSGSHTTTWSRDAPRKINLVPVKPLLHNCLPAHQHDGKDILVAKLNLDALLSLSRAIRGRPCTYNVSKRPRTGSLNWAIFVSLSDGQIGLSLSAPWPPCHPWRRIRCHDAHQRGFYVGVSRGKHQDSRPRGVLVQRSDLPPQHFLTLLGGSCENDIGVPYILISNQ